jgi:hypothetical protein
MLQRSGLLHDRDGQTCPTMRRQECSNYEHADNWEPAMRKKQEIALHFICMFFYSPSKALAEEGSLLVPQRKFWLIIFDRQSLPIT